MNLLSLYVEEWTSTTPGNNYEISTLIRCSPWFIFCLAVNKLITNKLQNTKFIFWMSFMIFFSIIFPYSSFVRALFPFNYVCPTVCCGLKELFFNCRSICISRFLLVFILGIQVNFLVNEFHYFSLNIGLFHDIFLCMAWKNHTIILDNLI